LNSFACARTVSLVQRTRVTRIAAAAAALLTGCGGLAADPPPASTAFAPSWEEYRAGARNAAGGAEHFAVEWDLIFDSEQALRAHYEREVLGLSLKLALFVQESTGFEATHPRERARDLTYCISNAFADKPLVVSDMAAATSAWAEAADVHFRHVASEDESCNRFNTSVDFSVLPTSSIFYTACAVSRLLWENGPRCFVGINPVVGVLQIDYARIPGAPPDDGLTPRGVLQHELGHILGFRHEHPWAPQGGGCSEERSVPRNDLGARRLTDEYDSDDWDRDSVMQYPACAGQAGEDFALSELDRAGARVAYGMPLAWYPAALAPLSE
jgi:serralysin